MTRFEYKTISVSTKKKNAFSMIYLDKEKLNESLKDLGEQGWELVSTINHNLGGSMVEILMVFKRAIG
jgi:hypothetical protein